VSTSPTSTTSTTSPTTTSPTKTAPTQSTSWTRSLTPACSLQDLAFQLFDVLDIERTVLAASPRFQAHTRDVVESALSTAQQVALRHYLPHNRKSDLQEPTFDPATGKVAIIPEVKAALEQFRAAGLCAAHADEDLGGMQLPSTVTNALMVPFYAANIGTASYTFLTTAAGNMLRKYGSRQQMERYLAPMLEGRFTGTMSMSETQAGSSLGDIATKAVRRADGTYAIVGKKMWISGGEHDLSENIVNMVLAKVVGPEAPNHTPAGVKSISLFVVPKFRVNPDGSLGPRNGVSLGGLNKKLGWRGTTNCGELLFGEQGECVGELLGEEGKGLSVMFTMMNEARITIGFIAAALAYAGFAASVSYASERGQGRAVDNKDPASPPVLIKDHPDVRRMLLLQQSYAEGALALCLYASRLVDRTHQAAPDADPALLKREALLLDVLTPIVKSWPSQWCLESNSTAIQVHGGYGYTRDFAVEQHYRSARLNMIHEGTNGIQSLDLLGRKMLAMKGLPVLLDAVRGAVEDARAAPFADAALQRRAQLLAEAADRLERTTAALANAPLKTALANSHEYLNMAGFTVVAWMWLAQETAAARKLAGAASGGLGPDETDFLRAKRRASRYFFAYELPRTKPQAELLQSLDDVLLDAEF